MLPRKALSRIALTLILLASGFVVSDPSFAAVISKPSVSTSEIAIDSVTEVSPGLYQLVEPQEVSPFTLVGISWLGSVSQDVGFQVRIREEGTWSQWYNLSHSDEHNADDGSAEEVKTLSGTDPLLTGPSDAIEVQMTSPTSEIPTYLKVSLIDSRVTLTDRMVANGVDVSPQVKTQGLFGGTSIRAADWPSTVTTPSGAVVDRPNIVSRAAWGADESKWLGPIRIGTGIQAGFIHHTVNTNDYTADQVPGMLREMFVYFTQVRGYADLPYNFLIDKYGTIYEGRRGCAPGTDTTCDSAAQPNQGAHTAGFNPNTFAVSAIGSYHLSTAADAAVLVNPIAQLFAWKFAPYGTDPLGTTTYLTKAPGNTGRWAEGTTVTIPTINGHRDVGVTTCPGNYLYQYVPAIRARASDLLTLAIKNVAVAPNVISYTDGTPITVSANIPVNSTWHVDVKDANGKIIESSGTQTTTGLVSYTWNKPAGLAPGRYSVNINALYTPQVAQPSASPTPDVTATPDEAVITPASYSTSSTSFTTAAYSSEPIQLKERTAQVIVATAPSAVTAMQFIRVSSKATKIKWSPVTTDLVNATEYSYRYSTNAGKSWSGWTPTSATEATLGGWKSGKTWQIQVVARNFVGDSAALAGKYKAGAVAAKPRVPSVSFTRVSSTSTRINWAPSKSDKLPVLTSYFRYSLNGKTWSAWTATTDRTVTMTGLTKNKNYKVQIKLANDVGTGTVAAKTFKQKK